ncbi:MAG TPA: hypothetical protein VG317_02380 [Pseudonocardiaceae bacterium]|jgi:uncharacterized protein (DUF1330 family)|nr:hypothetical protein [Pseudonocardiaceae bacterium]
MSHVTLCVQLWARAGQETVLADYEDQVLCLLPAHAGRVLSRVRSLETGDQPHEVQVIEFAAERAIDDYLRDPTRVALAGLRDRAIERTEMFRVTTIG